MRAGPAILDLLSRGFTIVESKALLKQWRFPRSKKRRIRKKWAARPANWKPDKLIYKSGNMLVCHPETAAKIRAEVEIRSRIEEPV